jgi:hypothetical protein
LTAPQAPRSATSPLPRDPAQQPALAVSIVDPLADPRWDAAIASFPQATVFHTAAWAQVLHTTYGYKPLYFALLVRESRSSGSDLADSTGREPCTTKQCLGNLDGARSQLRPAAILPMFEVSSLLTGRRGISLPFTDAIEPLFASSAGSPCAPAECSALLFNEATRQAKSRGWKYLELRGGADFFPEAPTGPAFLGHRLDLTPGGEAVFSGFESSVRRAVRKAEKSGIAVTCETSIEAVRVFYALYCLTRKKHGHPPQPWSFFANIQRHILAPGRGCIFLARAHGGAPSQPPDAVAAGRATQSLPPPGSDSADDGQLVTRGHAGRPIAALMFFRHGKTCLYKFGASDDTCQHLRANNLLMWEAIKHFTRAGMQTLDFGRTSLGNEGLRNYKLGWGTEEFPIRYVKFDLRKSAFVPFTDNSDAWHTRYLSRLPVWALRTAGRILYRHIA